MIRAAWAAWQRRRANQRALLEAPLGELDQVASALEARIRAAGTDAKGRSRARRVLQTRYLDVVLRAEAAREARHKLLRGWGNWAYAALIAGVLLARCAT